MLPRLWAIYRKHQKIVNYLVLGGLTTVINLVCYFVLAKVFGIEEITSNAIAWVVAVALHM